MSWGTCYSGSNNIHTDFPPIMHDGRNYADWQPGAVINENIRKEAKITSNWEYRKYLCNNADTIIKYNQLSACGDCCANTAQYGTGQTVSNNSPYLFKSCVDNNTAKYGYETSDLKNLYLNDYSLQARMVTPVFTQSNLLQQGYPRAN
jgi:hypothetical protein